MIRYLLLLSLFVGTSFASIDSGGGSSSISTNTNTSSIGGYLATVSTSVGSRSNNTGIVQVIYVATDLPVNLDADADGIPDDWEELYGLSTSINDSDSDHDNDGMSALDEYIAGTLPNDANSRLEITIKMLGGIAEISYNTVIGRNYELLVSENLETFVSWSTAAGNNAQHTLTFDPESASAGVNFGSNPEKMFFQVRVELSE